MTGSLAFPGCDDIGAGGPVDDQRLTATPDTDAEPETPPEDEALPVRIYYDLTRHDWYAHGEPLVLSQDTYEAGTGLLAASADDMAHIGEYAGVDVYAAGDNDSTVYVPVFPRYWQPFHRVSERAARR